jgi:hypothetical protein
VESTWETRDLPVLEAIVRLYDEGNQAVEARELTERTGFDYETVQQALWALAYEQPPFFDPIDTSTFGARDMAAVRSVSGHARRTVGAWPTPEGLADRIIAALNEAADNEPDEVKKGKLRRGAEAVGGVGKGVITDVLAQVITRGMYGS